MPKSDHSVTPRREFLKNTARIAAASALAGVAIPHVHAGEDNTIRLALIGCGGRGSGAVANAMSAGGLVIDNSFRPKGEENASGGPVKLVAMADLFPDRLDQSHSALSKVLGNQIDVPKERQFLGFDAYRKAIDCLRPGDVAHVDHPRRLPRHAPGVRGGERRQRVHGEDVRLRSGAACSR